MKEFKKNELSPTEIADLLADQEYQVALLYQAFAERFPRYRELWEDIARDELEHQQLVLSFKKHLEEGKLFFNAMMLNIGTIEKQIQLIATIATKTQNGEISEKEALEQAVEIEGSLVDQEMFRFFKGDSKIYREGLGQLSSQTQSHYNKLLEAVKNYKKPQPISKADIKIF